MALPFSMAGHGRRFLVRTSLYAYRYRYCSSSTSRRSRRDSNSSSQITYDFDWSDFLQYRSRRQPLDEEATRVLTANLARTGNINGISSVIQYRNDLGQTLDTQIYLDSLRAVVNSMQVEKLKTIYSAMQKSMVEMDVEAYKLMIEGYGRAKMLSGVEWTLQEMEKARFQKDLSCYMALVKAYARCERPDSAWAAFDELRRSGHKLTADAYITPLWYFSRGGDVKKVEEFVAEMRERHISLNSMVLTFVMQAHAESGDFVRAEEILTSMERRESMLKPTRYTYEALMKCYGKVNRIDRAEELFKKLERLEKPTAKAYNTLLRSFATNGCAMQTERLAYAMLRVNIPWTSSTYAYLIESNLKAPPDPKNVVDAHRWYREMLRKGTRPFSQAHTYLVQLYCRQGDVPSAVTLIQEAHLKGIPVLTFAYNALIAALGRKGDLDGAEATLEEMRANNILRTNETFNAMLFMYATNNAPQRIDKLLLTLGSRFVMSTKVKHAIAAMKVRDGDRNSAINLYKSIDGSREKPMLWGYNINLKAFAEDEDPTKHQATAMKIYEFIKRVGMKPNGATYNLLILINCNNEDHLRRIFASMRENLDALESTALRRVLSELSDLKNAQPAMEGVKNILRSVFKKDKQAKDEAHRLDALKKRKNTKSLRSHEEVSIDLIRALRDLHVQRATETSLAMGRVLLPDGEGATARLRPPPKEDLPRIEFKLRGSEVRRERIGRT